MKHSNKAGNLLPIMSYHGNEIVFEVENHDVKVNVTRFAKCFPDKNLSQIINSQEISEYVERLAEITNYSSADLLEVRKGGNVAKQGTWANRKVALRIAQKLNVDFAIMVDMKIEELLFGKTQPKQIAQDGTLIENQVFPRKLGNGSIKCYYTNGTMYAQISSLVNYLRNSSGSFGKYLVDKLGEENFIYVPIANQQVRFGNYQAFRNYLEYTKTDIPFGRINDAARNIWSVDMSENEDEPYAYHYTAFQMNGIYETLFTRNVNKHRVMELLGSGRIEKGSLI
jgi:hypothetical protein